MLSFAKPGPAEFLRAGPPASMHAGVARGRGPTPNGLRAAHLHAVIDIPPASFRMLGPASVFRWHFQSDLGGRWLGAAPGRTPDCVTWLPGGTLRVSQTLPPTTLPLPNVIRPRMVAPA
jgi:hypothetical protein